MRKFRVVVEGKTYEVDVEEMNANSSEQAQSAPAVAPVQSAPAAPSVAKDGVQLKAPMPGAIISFSVAEGASVKRGDKVLVLEAMKMENDIQASADGKISFVVTKGATVNSGDILAVIS